MIYLSPPSAYIPDQQRCMLCSKPPRHHVGHFLIPDIHAGGELDGLVMCLRCSISQLVDRGHIEAVMKQRLHQIDRDIARRRASLTANELDDLQVERACCFSLMGESWDFLGLDSGLWSDQRARSPWSDEQIAYARRLLVRSNAIY
jgi:hypothetical protein